jgi:hypothetical protein
MLIVHAGIITILLSFLSSGDWSSSPRRWGQDHLQETGHLAEIVASPELHSRLPWV